MALKLCSAGNKRPKVPRKYPPQHYTTSSLNHCYRTWWIYAFMLLTPNSYLKSECCNWNRLIRLGNVFLIFCCSVWVTPFKLLPQFLVICWAHLLQGVGCSSVYLCCIFKLMLDFYHLKQFLKNSDQPIWYWQPCHIQSLLNLDYFKLQQLIMIMSICLSVLSCCPVIG